MKIYPQDDLILVEMKERKNITPDGIHLPENVRDARELVFVEVLEVGQGAPNTTGTRTPHSVKKGDLLLMASGSPKFPVEYSNLFTTRANKNMPKLMLIARDAVLARVELEPGERINSPVVTTKTDAVLVGAN